ncbi:WD40/YVTN/BNR-like repeat-containing protein, partial [Xanthovirga aplysinae]|uniref:WD40/YVTN/BNR-like repeat-containing protein n=1 Tax=Xanthovirga aplysinae TaxID=2529853 RepID=UPI0012BB7373
TLALSIFSLILLLSCNTKQKEVEKEIIVKGVTFIPQNIDSKASLRGLFAVNNDVVWASGSEGTVIKTINGGKQWEIIKVNGADTLDFRDIHAFDQNTAYILSAGQPARLYKTTDGGKNWQLQYENLNPQVFFDGFDFWDQKHGIAMSDPVAGKLLLIKTKDGDHWEEISTSTLPPSLEGEGGFAASGTNITVQKNKFAWIATGGPEARIFFTQDQGNSWEVTSTPIHSPMKYAGIYSIAFKNPKLGIAVGGSFAYPDSALNNAGITYDGGKSWELIKNGPRGFRSCIAFLPFSKNSWFTVSRAGGEYSNDDGNTWTPYNRKETYYAFSIATDSNYGWASGKGGKLSKVVFELTE